MSFSDHFSGHAAVYASARPTYPTELFEYLRAQCIQTELAWDCAAGNGQAARGLKEHFETVLLSDASKEQIFQFNSEATDQNNLLPAVMLAEQTALASASIDLVVVAQALHWFDTDKFFAELERVLRPEGVFAAWSYGIHYIDEDIDAVVYELYEDIVGEYWPRERRIVENHYRDIDFPFNVLSTPDFKLLKSWSIEQVLAYLNSWSAVQRYRAQRGEDPILLIRDKLQKVWGSESQRPISWPLTLKVCKKA